MGKWILAIVQQICGKIPNGKKGWENMKKLASAVAILAVLAAPAHAGFRGGGGGFRSSGFRSSGSFSRSYSRPSSSYSSRNTTVIQNHNYGGGGMGSSGFLWGYLLGNSGSHAQAPAAPTVVVVPQGGATAPAISPNVSTVAPIAPTPAPVIEQEPEDGGIGLFGSFLIAIGLGGLVWWLIRRSSNRKGAFA